MQDNRGWQGRLEEHLRAGLQPAEELDGLGHRLNLWVTDGAGDSSRLDGVDPTVGGLVEVRVARYFDRAIDIGRKWGMVYGAVLGAGSAVIILLGTWVGIRIFG